MKKTILFLIGLLSCMTTLSAADSIVGFWKTIDEKTGKPQSIVAIYKYQDKYYGRLIVTYDDNGNIEDTVNDPKIKAPGVVGDPYYAGMDILWNLQEKGSKYEDGSIIDPEKGYVYGAELWREGDNLIVRGELLFLGRNQTWPPAAENDFPHGFKKPNLSTLVPVIPVVK